MKISYTAIIILIILLCGNNSFSQSPVEIVWQKCLGGFNTEKAWDLVQADDGGYVFVGQTNSSDGDVIGLHGITGSPDTWLVKTDSIGNLVWQSCLGDADYDFSYTLTKTFDGGYAIANTISSAYIWLVKTDNSGVIEFDSTYHSGVIQALTQTSDGGFLMVGAYSLPYNNSDIILIKTDSLGNRIWTKIFGGGDDDWGMDVIQTSDGGYLFAANSYQINGNGMSDVWIVKTDTSGNIIWDEFFGGTNTDFPYSIIESNDGGIFITGSTKSNDIDVTGNHQPGGSTEDIWVLKIDSVGNLLWQNCFGGSSTEIGYDAYPLENGGIVITGYTQSYNGNVSGNHGPANFKDAWVIKIDDYGNLLWQKCLGGTSHETGNAIIENSDGDIIMAGFTMSYNFDVSGNHGNEDSWLVKLSERYNLIKGKIFIDSNSNSLQDSNEVILSGHEIVEMSTGNFTFSNLNGQYNLIVTDTGNFTISTVPPNYYLSVPGSHTSYFNLLHQTDSLKDFAFQPAGIFNDLQITITPLSPFRPGFDCLYSVTYSNVGTTILNPEIIFYPDSNLTYLSALPSAASVTSDSMIWNFGPLAPFESGTIYITLNVDSTLTIGSLINSGTIILPLLGDANTINNQSYIESEVTGSFDPNDIRVNRTYIYDYDVPFSPWLEYTIRFQNTGNDTAFSAHIFNPLSTFVEEGTFEFIGSSHPVTIEYQELSRQMAFHFQNLFLPDSGINEPASHGFIKYRIRPATSLVAGNIIQSHATIFFDFNPGIKTDTAATVVINTTSVNNEPNTFAQLKIFPNPTSNFLNLQSEMKAGKYTITISDITGRLVLKQSVFPVNQALHAKMEISSLNKGIYLVEVNGENDIIRSTFVKE